MKFIVLTLFPELIEPFFNHGVLGRALRKGSVAGEAVNIRDFASDPHNSVDDKPYGGGLGMVMKPEPLDAALNFAKMKAPGAKTLLMSPQGICFSQRKARSLACEKQGLILVCGRYEGVDERVCQMHVDEEISLGDYVMTGGEIAAMAVIDSVARFVPGVLGREESAENDSFKDDRLEYEHYTRPAEFKGRKVPDILLSGNHEKIESFRQRSSILRTVVKRPDLFEKSRPDREERRVLKQLYQEIERVVKE